MAESTNTVGLLTSVFADACTHTHTCKSPTVFLLVHLLSVAGFFNLFLQGEEI